MLRRKSLQIHRSSVSAETVFDNEDLLRQILLRLPVRSLLKFKSVSKRWCSLISSRSFSHHHGSISHPLTPSGIFLGREYHYPPVFDFVNLSTNPSRAPFESLDFTGQKRRFEILQSCNGLLLCSTSWNEDKDYYIHNPTTKQFTKIPNFSDEDGEGVKTFIFCMSLAFDPSLSPNYEVVCVQKFDYYMSRYQIKIYSSQTGEWRLCNAVLEVSSTIKFRVYWKKAIYWLNRWNDGFYFDLCEEKVHEMPMPLVSNWEWDKRRVEHFGDCGGHLYLIEIYYLELDVWEMQDDHSGWFVKYNLDFESLYAGYPKLISDDFDFGENYPLLSVLAMIDQSDQVDEEPYLVLHIHGEGGEEEEEEEEEEEVRVHGEEEEEEEEEEVCVHGEGEGEEEEEEEEEEVVVCVHEEGEGQQVIRLNVKSGSFEKLMEIKKVKEFSEVDAYLYIESLASV